MFSFSAGLVLYFMMVKDQTKSPGLDILVSVSCLHIIIIIVVLLLYLRCNMKKVNKMIAD